jgi:hypothetical protein
MGNHYRFVVQTHQLNLSRFMRHVNGVYTQAHNGHHSKVGHASPNAAGTQLAWGSAAQ